MPLADAAEGWTDAEQRGLMACMIRDYWFIERNEPCHCGSGRKYKHCHGTN